jgi:predicted transcriptional regulator
MTPTATHARDALPPVASLLVPSEMVVHLGKALRELRRQKRIRLIEIAYPLRKSEASMSRFEGGRVQPTDLDAVVNAYAAELDMEPLARVLYRTIVTSDNSRRCS